MNTSTGKISGVAMNSKDCKIYIAEFIKTHPEFLDLQAKFQQLIAYQNSVKNFHYYKKNYPESFKKCWPSGAVPTFEDSKEVYDQTIRFSAIPYCWKRCFKSSKILESSVKKMLYPDVFLPVIGVLNTRVFTLHSKNGGWMTPYLFLIVYETDSGLYISDDIGNYPEMLEASIKECKKQLYGIADYDLESDLKRWGEDSESLTKKLKELGVI